MTAADQANVATSGSGRDNSDKQLQREEQRAF
jgi:hypothetical protein